MLQPLLFARKDFVHHKDKMQQANNALLHLILHIKRVGSQNYLNFLFLAASDFFFLFTLGFS